jgi:ribosomal protein S18 acetylase RimI-like enzyme
MKQATAFDIPNLLELMGEFYAEAGYALDRERAKTGFAALLKDHRLGSVWLIESTGGPAGYVVLTHCFTMEYGGNVGFVDDLFVRPTFRRCGLGTTMLQELRAHCLAIGVRALFVEVAPDNTAAQAVYRRAGFSHTNRQILSLALSPPSHLES